VEVLYPPHNRQDAVRSADRRFGCCCHNIATNRPLCRMSRFNIEPALVLGHNFPTIVLLQSLEHWQELTAFRQLYGLQFARELGWHLSNMKVCRPQRVVQAVHDCCLRNLQDPRL
jgi:hypothetical protein